MDAKKILRILSAMIIMAAMLSMVITPAAAQTPDPWEPFCSGSGALVLQEESNTGDGVSMSVQDMVANWKCDQQSPILAYVEPWDGNNDRDMANFEDKFNPEAMCIGTPQEILDFATRTGLANGSLWIDVRDYANHPLVVSCSEVDSADTFGLNPMENQIDLDRMGWVRARAEELFGIQKYVDAYPNDLLATRMTQLGWASGAANKGDGTGISAGSVEPPAEEAAPAENPADTENVAPPEDPRIDTLTQKVDVLAAVVTQLVEAQKPPVEVPAKNFFAGFQKFVWWQFILAGILILFVILIIAWWITVIVRAWRKAWYWGLAFLVGGLLATPLISAIVGEILLRRLRAWPMIPARPAPAPAAAPAATPVAPAAPTTVTTTTTPQP